MASLLLFDWEPEILLDFTLVLLFCRTAFYILQILRIIFIFILKFIFQIKINCRNLILIKIYVE